MIRGSDKISAVLARDERLLDVLVSAARPFENLRNPLMRRVMAQRVTVEQAAKIAGLAPAALVDRLNRALGFETAPTEPPPPAMTPESIPAGLLATPPHLIVDLDVRDDLRNGHEPFAKIMNAQRTLTKEQVLRLRAIFEPAPLYAVFGKKGLAHFTERLAADDWRVWFFHQEGIAAPQVVADPFVLDVRDLEPPEPMVRTLEALENLKPGETLVQLNVRVPQFLLPKLEERGFTYEIHEQSKDLVRLFIRHKESH